MSNDFDKEWGFAPDQDYELRKCNKTPEEISKIMEVKNLEVENE